MAAPVRDEMPVVLTCSVVFSWVRMPISSIQSLRLPCVVYASYYMRSSGAVPVSCFSQFALVSVFSLTLAISVSSVGRRYMVFFRRKLFFGFVVFFIFFRLLLFYFIFLNLFPCPADHEPNWQPRAVFFLFLNMVGARSVNVMNTTITTVYAIDSFTYYLVLRF